MAQKGEITIDSEEELKLIEKELEEEPKKKLMKLSDAS